MRWMFALLMLVLLQGVATAQPAGSPEEVELSLEDRRHASALSSSTLSPFCPGRTLSSCPSGKATEWRRDIRTWVAEGLDDKEILARLQARAPGFQLGRDTPDRLVLGRPAGGHGAPDPRVCDRGSTRDAVRSRAVHPGRRHPRRKLLLCGTRTEPSTARRGAPSPRLKAVQRFAVFMKW